MKNKIIGFILTFFIISLPVMMDLKADDGAMSLPPSIQSLPVLKAEPWLQISPNPDVFIEAPAFDRNGNLYISSGLEGRVLKISPNKEITTLVDKPGLFNNGIAIHKNGKIYVVCGSGKIIRMNPDGSDLTFIETMPTGRMCSWNDAVFNNQGNLYVTDWSGTANNPVGGVYRFSADFKTVEPVIVGLAKPNGISLSPEGNVLWISETSTNRLWRVQLAPDGISLDPFEGTRIPHRFIGAPGGCDGNTIDAKGNLYQCIIFHGRALVLNPAGVPTANVLIPGRERGEHLISTNATFKPGTDQVYMTVSGKGGAWIYRFQALAQGLPLYSYQ